MSEFNRVAQQVDQYLSYSGLIPDQLPGDIRIDQNHQFYSFFVCHRCQQGNRVLKAVADIEQHALRFQLPVLELRVVENVVDDMQ